MKKREPRSTADLIGVKPKRDRRGNPKGVGGKPPTATRDRLNEANAIVAEIKAAKMRAELVAAKDVKAEWESALADLRAALLALPSRIGGKFALDRVTVAGIDAEVRTMLRALAASGGRSDG